MGPKRWRVFLGYSEESKDYGVWLPINKEKLDVDRSYDKFILENLFTPEELLESPNPRSAEVKVNLVVPKKLDEVELEHEDLEESEEDVQKLLAGIRK